MKDTDKTNDQLLKTSEEVFRQLTDNIGEVIWLASLDLNEIFYVSPAYEEVWGRSCESLYNEPESFIKAIHPDDRARALAAFNKRRDQSSFSTEYRIVRPDGSVRWIYDHGFHVTDSTGKPYRVAGIAQDITRVRQIGDAIRESESVLRTCFDSPETADSLTGLANRYAFDAYFEEEWKRALRSGYPLSIMMIDVDFLKEYNDAYGHLKGDQCLMQVADILKGFTRRPGDMAARFGGEQFVIVLPGAETRNTVSIAEKMVGAIEGLKIPHEKSEISDYLTVSIGVVTEIPQKNISPVDLIKSFRRKPNPILQRTQRNVFPADLIKSADNALKKAKKEGRNRVVVIQA